jgi:hypothetical protein
LLQSKYTCKYDYWKAQCEHAEVIEDWFQLVDNTIKKYGITGEDIFNFNKTGFAMEIAGTSRVVTSSN